MKFRTLLLAGFGIGALGFAAVSPVPERLIWNRSGSLPQGLYWLSDDPFTHGRWVIVSAKSAEAQWAARHGFTGSGWPLLKEVAGLPGDEICRNGTTIRINGKPVGEARLQTDSGLVLPEWSGCRWVEDGEVFLMNAHPASLDGRYFGVTRASDIEGTALRLFGPRKAPCRRSWHGAA